jgi:fused signal recognition particle receptor
MAFGFIKKVFSFGKKDEEEGAVTPPPQEAPAAEARTPAPAAHATAAPAPDTPPQVPEFLRREVAEAADAAPAETPLPQPEPAPPPPPPIEEPPVVPAAPEPRFEPAPDVPAFLREAMDERVAAEPDPAETNPTPPAPALEPAEPAREASPPPAPVPAAEPPKPTLAPAAAPSPAPIAPPARVTIAKTVERKAEEAPVPAAPAPRVSWYQRLREGLSRSSRELSTNISGIFVRRRLDEDTLQDLEDVLIQADLGIETAMRITDTLSSGRYGKEVSDAEVRAIMASEVEKVLTPVARPLELDLSHKPHVILVVGVNGTGKTTTIGKLAAKLTAGGLSVTLAAGDTFRAAAIEQLKIWGERTGSPVVSSKLGADAAGLAFDAFEKAKANGSDVLIIDTAGRLQNKAELMAELEKIVRVLSKHDPEAPHTVLQTVDATTGQNALNQVEIFRNVAGVNGLVMTKLDGTARGGILVGIAAKHRLPVYFIGVGEGVDDLEPFSASDFAKAIAGVD